MPAKCKFIFENGEKCGKDASHGYRDKPGRLYCGTHSKLVGGLVNKKSYLCTRIYDNGELCNNTAYYSYKDDCNENKIPLFCKDCADKKTMERPIKYTLCIKCNKTEATFCIGNSKKRLYCAKCRDILLNEDENLDINDNRDSDKCIVCLEQKVKIPIRSNYGYVGKKATHCLKHSDKNMINVKSSTCYKCDRRPHFGNITDRKAVSCSEHKIDDMVNLYASSCEIDGCDIMASFCFHGEKMRRCDKHKLDGMFSNKHRICIDDGCSTQAVFNYQDENIGLYCVKHKEKDMVNVLDKKCSVQNCMKQPIYGIPGKSQHLCGEHKAHGTISNSLRTCSNKHCKRPATYGIIRHEHCDQHATDGEIELIMKECINCKFINILSEDQICCICDPSFDKGIRYLARQRYVKSYIDNRNLDYIIYDSTINNIQNGRERPDFVFHNKTLDFYIVLEVDEKQHMSYSNELDRMNNICDYLGKPTFFIRFNPDNYTTDYVKYDSSNIDDRLHYLCNVLSNIINMDKETYTSENFGYLNVMYLYYNEYVEKMEKFVTIREYTKHDEPINKDVKTNTERKQLIIRRVVIRKNIS